LKASIETGTAHEPRSLLFGENWEDGEDFRPDTYIDVTNAYATWQDALGAYEIGRVPAPGFPYRDYYSALSRMRGCAMGTGYAEAFQSASVEMMAGLGLGLQDRWRLGPEAGS
jgi:N-acetylglucosamine malate deacetylase 1